MGPRHLIPRSLCRQQQTLQIGLLNASTAGRAVHLDRACFLLQLFPGCFRYGLTLTQQPAGRRYTIMPHSRFRTALLPLETRSPTIMWTLDISIEFERRPRLTVQPRYKHGILDIGHGFFIEYLRLKSSYYPRQIFKSSKCGLIFAPTVPVVIDNYYTRYISGFGKPKS